MIIDGEELNRALGNMLTFFQADFKVVKTISGGSAIQLRNPPRRQTAAEIVSVWRPVKISGLDFQIQPGTLNGLYPSNRSLVVTVPASSTDGYHYWLEATLDATNANLAVVTSVQYVTGASAPTPLPDSWPAETFPTIVNIPLGYVTSNATVIDGIYQVKNTSLNIVMGFFPVNSTLTRYTLTVS